MVVRLHQRHDAMDSSLGLYWSLPVGTVPPLTRYAGAGAVSFAGSARRGFSDVRRIVWCVTGTTGS